MVSDITDRKEDRMSTVTAITLCDDLHDRAGQQVAFPTLDELNAYVLQPLDAAHESLEAFSMNLGGLLDRDGFQHGAELDKPPNLGTIGTFWAFLDYLDASLASLHARRDELRECMPALDDLRLNGWTRYGRPRGLTVVTEAPM